MGLDGKAMHVRKCGVDGTKNAGFEGLDLMPGCSTPWWKEIKIGGSSFVQLGTEVVSKKIKTDGGEASAVGAGDVCAWDRMQAHKSVTAKQLQWQSG